MRVKCTPKKRPRVNLRDPGRRSIKTTERSYFRVGEDPAGEAQQIGYWDLVTPRRCTVAVATALTATRSDMLADAMVTR